MQLNHPGLGEKSRSETKPVPTEGLRVLSESAQMVLYSWRNHIQRWGGQCEPVPKAILRSLWLKLPFRFKILHPAHKRVSRVVGLGRSGSFRVALGS